MASFRPLPPFVGGSGQTEVVETVFLRPKSVSGDETGATPARLRRILMKGTL